MSNRGDDQTAWWRAPGLQDAFVRIGKAASNRDRDVDAFLAAQGLKWCGRSGVGTRRTLRQVAHGQHSTTLVQGLRFADGRAGVVEPDGTVLITSGPVHEFPPEILGRLTAEFLFNATSGWFSSLARDIVDRGLRGIGLHAGDTWYVVRYDLPGSNPDRRFGPSLEAFDAGNRPPRRAFSVDSSLARDVANLSAIRRAMEDPAMQQRIFAEPVVPAPTFPPGVGPRVVG